MRYWILFLFLVGCASTQETECDPSPEHPCKEEEYNREGNPRMRSVRHPDLFPWQTGLIDGRSI